MNVYGKDFNLKKVVCACALRKMRGADDIFFRTIFQVNDVKRVSLGNNGHIKSETLLAYIFTNRYGTSNCRYRIPIENLSKSGVIHTVKN